jgi:hypothetical protein
MSQLDVDCVRAAQALSKQITDVIYAANSDGQVKVGDDVIALALQMTLVSHAIVCDVSAPALVHSVAATYAAIVGGVTEENQAAMELVRALRAEAKRRKGQDDGNRR